MDELLALLRSKARPLAVNGQLVSGRAFGQLAVAYVEALNQGAVPQLVTAWQVRGPADWQSLEPVLVRSTAATGQTRG
jgi:hypothetical protein